jgi:hypothetical protein
LASPQLMSFVKLASPFMFYENLHD